MLVGIVIVLGVKEVGGAEGARESELGWAGLYSNYATGLDQLGALHYSQTDAARAEDDRMRS